MEVTKQQRADWLNATLDARGLSDYGRAAHICKRLGCSNAVAAGWLRGSLPSDLKLAMDFCREFSISLHNWVYVDDSTNFDSSNGGIPADRLLYTVQMVRKYERDHARISDEQYAWLMQRLASTDQPKQELQQISEVIELFSKEAANEKQTI